MVQLANVSAFPHMWHRSSPRLPRCVSVRYQPGHCRASFGKVQKQCTLWLAFACTLGMRPGRFMECAWRSCLAGVQGMLSALVWMVKD